MAAKKKVSEPEEVAKKKAPKTKAGAEPVKKAKEKAAETPAKPKTTRAAKPAKAAEKPKATKEQPKETKSTASKIGGLIKRVAKALPGKKVARAPKEGAAATKRAAAKTGGSRAAAAVAEKPVSKTQPAAPSAAGRPSAPEGDSRLVLMMRDPQTLHAFWSISAADREKYGLEKAGGAPPLLLRLYDRENGDGANEVYRCQIVVASTERWTVQVPPSGRTWRAEIGFIGKDGRFKAIASSNLVVLQGPPKVMAIEEGKGPTQFGEGAEALREWANKFELPFVAQVPIMPTMAQPGSLMKLPVGRMELQQPGSLMGQPGSQMAQPGSIGMKVEKEKGFWLQVATELILYGSTVPGSHLTVQDIPVELDKEGRFSLRFALPEGFHVLPVHAVSADGDDERTITPIVLRLTQ